MTPFVVTQENCIVRARHREAGFGIFGALAALAFIGFVAAAAMGMMRIRYAILGFVVAFIIVTALAMIPDIMRYSKISSM